MIHETRSYQTETPVFLWTHWTEGPASDYDRYKDRLTELIAEDVLEHCSDRLTERERKLAEEIRENGHV